MSRPQRTPMRRFRQQQGGMPIWQADMHRLFSRPSIRSRNPFSTTVTQVRRTLRRFNPLRD